MDVEMRDARGNSPSGGNLNHPNLLGNGPSADPNRADPGSNKSAADDLLAMFSSLSEEEKRKALQRVQQAAGNVSQDSKIAEMEARLAQLEAGRALEGGSQGNKPAVSGGKVVEKVVLDDLQYPKSNSAFQSAPASHMHATAKAMKAQLCGLMMRKEQGGQTLSCVRLNIMHGARCSEGNYFAIIHGITSA
jgi:hypothetical protein